MNTHGKEWPEGSGGSAVELSNIFAALTPDQRDELKRIVEDWIDEGFTSPPYSSEQYDIFEALGLTGLVGRGSYDVTRVVDT